MSKPLVIYHGNCFDGFGAATAAWVHLGSGAEYVEGVYGQPIVDVTDREVYLLDFCYPRAVIVDMLQKAHKVTVVDHHATAEKALAGLEASNLHVVMDTSHSGAFLAWQFFHPDTEVPILIRYLEDRDMWWWRLPDSVAVSLALQSIDRRMPVWSSYLDDVGELIERGTHMVKYQEALVDQMVSQATFVQIFGWSVPVVNATTCFSEVAQKLLEKHVEAKFACYYFDRADGKRQWGARSRSDFDVSVVAKSLGGGGHPQAAGWQTNVPLVFSTNP